MVSLAATKSSFKDVKAVCTLANAASSNPPELSYNNAVNATAIVDPFPLLTKVLNVVPISLVTYANEVAPSENDAKMGKAPSTANY